MKTSLQQLPAAFRIFAGLLFTFITATTAVAQTSWADNAATVITNADGHDGTTADQAILIKDAAELAYFANQVNKGGQELKVTNGSGIDNTGSDSKKNFSGYYFALSADIDLNGQNWTPIGNSIVNTFDGHFDGNSHVVKGLKVNIQNSEDNVCAGLFGKVYGTLRNLGVWLAPDGITASSSEGTVYAGGLAGWITGYEASVDIRNCYVEAEGNGAVRITGSILSAYAGGIVGYMSTYKGTCLLTNCYATVDVIAKGNSEVNVGGIVGAVTDSHITISYTYATGNVEGESTGASDVNTGGICGNLGGKLTNSLALNKSISCTSNGDETWCNRIAGVVYGIGLSANYANPRMTLNGSLATSDAANDANGADTWLDTFTADLQKEPTTNNGWTSDNWTWTNGNLPQLRTVILNDKSEVTGYGNFLSEQPTLPASSYLEDKPAPPVVEPEPEPEPMPTVYYTVTLPVVEGAITDPTAGTYEVESWSTFRFYLTLDTAYSESQPVVTTSRYETLAPRSSDGAYQVKYVRNDVEVYIDGIVKNPDPVANETIEVPSPKVWKSGNNLYMQAVADEPGYIYTADGKLQTVCHLIAGEVGTVQLPAGIYFVRIGNERFKVVL